MRIAMLGTRGVPAHYGGFETAVDEVGQRGKVFVTAQHVIVGTIEGGATIPEAAEQCGVSISSVVRFLKLHRETGSVESAKFGGYKDFALAAHEDLVRQLVAEQPDITLAELEDRLRKKRIMVGKSSISRFLHHLKLPFKKKVFGRPSRTART